jgi:hypothetical protein
MVMAAAGVAGFCLVRRLRRPSTSAGVQIATTTSIAGVVGAFILQYGMRHLPFFVRQLWAAQQTRAASVGPELPEASASA